MEIACLGVVVADVVGKPIDALPERGTLQLIERLELHIGGNASNTAAALGKLGVGARLVGKVGDDNFGRFLVGALEGAGVDCSPVAIAMDGTPTPVSLVTVHSDAERSFLHAPGTNATLSFEDIAWEKLDGVRFLHVAGPQLLVALEGEPLADVLAEAQRRGMTTMLDTVMNPRSRGWDALSLCFPHLDWFVPSFEEIRTLTGEETVPGQIVAARAAGARNVAIKRGAEGCTLAPEDREPLDVPAFPVTVVDTLGAGDSWCAGFLTGLLKDYPLERCARLANAVGAACVGALGATAGIAALEEIEQRL
jgi:sugar/nucleoside kinase (ribokinase family)